MNCARSDDGNARPNPDLWKLNPKDTMMSRLESWVETANNADTEFPLNNLPYGVFSVNDGEPHCGVAIGNQILDVTAAEEAGVITPSGASVFDIPYWNDFMELGPAAWAKFRKELTDALSVNSEKRAVLEPHMVLRSDADMHMPFAVSEYTDFYAGKQHAQNMGAILRGSPDLPANWLHIPIGYNGRASSVVVSGTDIHRPLGQTKAPDAESPSFGPSKRLDIELELGAIVGTSSNLGTPVSVAEADAMIFGYVLLNDWSARDIQGWEYQPLGPFQGKAFGTSVSPWIVTTSALESFRIATPGRDRELLPYLDEEKPGLYDISLEVLMQPAGAKTSTSITRTNYSRMYYSAAQQLCHHSIGGCAMSAGDLLGSGTISGPTRDEFGSLMELSWAGREPFKLDSGETRGFLEDGDTMILRGHAQGDGFKVGFGDCSGTIMPAIDTPNWAK